MEINESLKQFLAKLAQDEELQAKMQAAENPEEAYTIASAIQSGFTKEEFVETMTAIKNQIDDELSDDDLEKVAGGKSAYKMTFVGTIGHNICMPRCTVAPVSVITVASNSNATISAI